MRDRAGRAGRLRAARGHPGARPGHPPRDASGGQGAGRGLRGDAGPDHGRHRGARGRHRGHLHHRQSPRGRHDHQRPRPHRHRRQGDSRRPRPGRSPAPGTGLRDGPLRQLPGLGPRAVGRPGGPGYDARRGRRPGPARCRPGPYDDAAAGRLADRLDRHDRWHAPSPPTSWVECHVRGRPDGRGRRALDHRARGRGDVRRVTGRRPWRADYEHGIYGYFYGSGELLPGISEEAVAAPGTADDRIQAYTFRVCVWDDLHGRPSRSRRPRATTAPRSCSSSTPWRPLDATGRRATTARCGPDHHPAAERQGRSSTTPGCSRPTSSASRRRGRRRTTPNGLGCMPCTCSGWPDCCTSCARIRPCPNHCGPPSRRGGCAPTSSRPRTTGRRSCTSARRRRLVGDVVLTQAEVQAGTAQPDPVAIGSYRIDNHVVQRVVDGDGIVLGEGSLDAEVRPYHVPMRALLPPRSRHRSYLVISMTVLEQPHWPGAHCGSSTPHYRDPRRGAAASSPAPRRPAAPHRPGIWRTA